MYKIIFDDIDSTFDQLYSNENYYKILKHQSFAIQSFKQNRGVGRGNKSWESPKGNFYITLNQKIKAKDVLKKSSILLKKYPKNDFLWNLAGMCFQRKRDNLNAIKSPGNIKWATLE